MNRILGMLLLVYGLFVLYVLSNGFRCLRNIIGKLNGWGICPGCGDTWWGKKGGMILYKPQNDEPPRQASFSLCDFCLANPCLLDGAEIARHLTKDEGWSGRRIEAVKEAVIRFQADGGNLRRL
ncbi:MAG: hypothetical protein ABIH38_01500 [Patescibacteria group bacterium]